MSFVARRPLSEAIGQNCPAVMTPFAKSPRYVIWRLGSEGVA
jgi:hypothetical protein